MFKFITIIPFLLTASLFPQTIKVGVSPEFPPFEYKRNSELVGFDIDLAKKIASMLNAEVEFKEMEVPALFNALARGDIDVIVSSITKTDEIAKEFSISDPYYYDTLVVLHRNNENITPPFKDKVIAHPLGSVIETWCKKNSSPKTLLAIDNFEQAIEDLLGGKIDGLLIDESQAKLVERQNKLLTHSEIGNISEGSCVILRKNSKNIGVINQALKQLHDIGYIEQLKLKWIETNYESLQKELHEIFVFDVTNGVILTLTYTIVAFLIGLTLGAALAVALVANFGRFLIKPFVSAICDTPLILQLSMVYFILPLLTGTKVNIMHVGVVTFGINAAAHICVILKASLDSIAKAQLEACKVLKITKYLAWKDIILPQAIRASVPLLIIQAVNVTKDTALISILGEADIAMCAQSLATEQPNFFFIPLCIGGLLYWLIIRIIKILGSILTKRYKYA